MAAVVKWKMIAALCLVLIIASQIATLWPLDRYLVSEHALQDQQELPEADHISRNTNSHNGAPFIRHTSNNLSSFNRNLRWQLNHQMQVEDFAEQGYLGPLSLLGHEEMELLPGIIRDWNRLKAHELKMLARDGFEAPAERTCFLWLEDCVRLARHKPILKVVESILGQPVLLFGMSVWSAAPNSRQALEINLEGFQCPTVDVVVNSGARIFQNSHRVTKKMVVKLANQLKTVHRFHSGSHVLHQRLQSVALSQLKGKIPGVDMVDMDPETGKTYVINGRLLYTLSNPNDTPRTSMLLQYVPANCTLRDQQPDGSQLGFLTRSLLPPTLRTSPVAAHEGANDIRDGLAQDEVVESTKPVLNKEYSLLPPLPQTGITVFRKQVQDTSNFSVPVGFARSPLLSRIMIETIVTHKVGVEFTSHPQNQLVVVVRGCLWHHHARKGYTEVRELKIGSITFLANSEVHALSSAAASTEYISIRWSGREDLPVDDRGFRKSFNDGKQVFEMPVGELGAVNAKTIMLRSGQAYDPENEADCDVLVLVVKGNHLQIIPFLEYLVTSEAVLIPAGEACILWNAGSMPVTIVALQLYRSLKKSIVDDRDSSLLEAAYRTRGKVM